MTTEHIHKATLIIMLFLGVVIPSKSHADLKLVKSTAHHSKNGYQNHPFVETAAPKDIFFYLRRFWNSVVLPDIPNGHALSETQARTLFNSVTDDKITWLGHASFLIHIAGKMILTDPFLTEFASPLSWAGPRRLVAPGISLDNLPPIDIVIVSHNHYDHLDEETVRNLKNKDSIQVVTPLGLKSFFEQRGFNNVSELDWTEQTTIDDIIISALPAVHNSARGFNDRNKTLWASWAITGPKHKLFFVGDSGYSEVLFQQIGNQYGPFDFAILPIGAYEPRQTMWMSHMTPEEAVTIGKDVRAKTLIASHWGTLNLSDESPWEPPDRFIKAGQESGYSEQTQWKMKIGETRPLD